MRNHTSIHIAQNFMDDNLTPLDVSHLNEEMVKAARAFADLKFNIDMLGRSRPKDIPDDLHGPMRGGEYGPDFASRKESK